MLSCAIGWRCLLLGWSGAIGTERGIEVNTIGDRYLHYKYLLLSAEFGITCLASVWDSAFIVGSQITAIE